MSLRRILLTLATLCTVSAFALTDKQVLDYIKQQTAAGKTEQQIGRELVAKGVTPEQAQRIKAKYQSGESTTRTTRQQIRNTQSVTAGRNNNVNKTSNASTNNKNTTVRDNTSNRNTGRSSAKTQRAGSSEAKLPTMGALDQMLVEGTYDENGDWVVDYEETLFIDENQEEEKVIYGHDVFSTENLTFEPSENLATPQNYRLGPNDEVIIDIWGASEDHLRETISPEGSIMIAKLGPIYLNGLTVNEASKRIKNAFSKKYAGMDDAETDIQVALGQVRSIQVSVMGEAVTPGTFQLSPFSTVFHALYKAGGINDIGSLRNIQVVRNGRKVAGVDIYEYLFKGKSSGNIRLQEGDVIIVPPYEQLVSIDGNVKRPMYYEIKPNETVQNILDYAGGFTGDAYSGMVRLSRQDGMENELFNVERNQFSSYKLKDGDLLTVGTILDRYSNRVEVKGAVYRPGLYAISRDLTTVKGLVTKADGLTEDAYTKRALLYREGKDLRLEVIALNIGQVMDGTAKDIRLKKNDILEIMSVQELEERGSVSIQGQVSIPGEYLYADNMTVEDLIFQAGGLLDGASTARVDIARRVSDPTATEQTSMLARTYSISIENGMAVGKDRGFVLEPFDVVTVRRSPGYVPQEFVKVTGEVLFDGEYALMHRNERISEVIARSGGVVDGAYVKGARLMRLMSEDEQAARQELIRLAKIQSSPNSGDSISMNKIEIATHYSVGIDLEKALKNPGSYYDLVLRPGDEIHVPEIQSTVSISGDVMFPNTVVYEPGKKLKHYIEQAGGYGQRAKKNKAFVIYLNGTVALAKKNVLIEPGCQIIVPSKPASTGVNWSQILTLISGFGSVATMAATVANLLK